MPPEEPGNLTVIDLRFEGDGKTLQATFERVDAPLKDWLAVSWASRTPPAGYAPLGGGTVCYREVPGLEPSAGAGEVDRIGNRGLSYGWRQKTGAQGLMLVLVLPAGYTLEASSAPAEAAKTVAGDTRIAVYWMLTSSDGRVSLQWTLVRCTGDLPSEAARLNELFYSGGRRASPGYVFIEPEEPGPRPSEKRPIRVFCSYSHDDEGYLEHLLKYLGGMKDEGFEFWHDRMIAPGEDWDERIRVQLRQSDIALILVSQSFLNSPYIRNVEIRHSIERREREGLRLLPVLLSPCDWKSQPWLARLQMIPRDERTLETHYRENGERNALFLTILQALRALGART